MVKHIDNQSFSNEVLESTVPVLVDFYADWCGPCKMMAPILDEIDSELGAAVSVCKVNVDECMALAQQYNIMNIPAMFVFKNGEIVEKVIGAAPKSSLVDLLKKHM